MPDPIFERYKEALRAGHVAALRGSPDDALLQYRAAASIAPDRALPHIGMADVLLRLGRHEEALAACAVALRLAPLDEAALDVAARVHAAAGRGSEAAVDLDRLADLRARQGRTGDACAAAARALEADPTDARRDRLATLKSSVDAERARLAGSGWAPEPAPDEASREQRPLDHAAPPMAPAAPVAPEPAASPAESPTPAAAPVAPESAASAAESPTPAAAPVAARDESDRATAGPAADAASPPEPRTSTSPPPSAPVPQKPPPVTQEVGSSVPVPAPPRPVDPEVLFMTAEEHAAGGDARRAALAYVEAAAAYLEAGAPDTAVDVCLRALAAAPGDADVHLALARIDLTTGHDGRAAQRLDLLERLLALDGDQEGQARVAAFREGARGPAGVDAGSAGTHRRSGQAAES
jgi:tetratricopeptide (TPR) repeat protein